MPASILNGLQSGKVLIMATSLNIVVEDNKGAKSTTSFNVDDAVSVAGLAEVGLAIAQSILTIVTGRIVSISACINVDLTSLTGNTVALNSDVEEGARFIWNSTGGFTTSNRLPTFDEQYIVAGSRMVNVDAPAVEAFINLIEGGVVTVGDGTVAITDYRGAEVVDLDSARESFQRSRK